MPMNGFSVGRDLTITIVSPDGVMDFSLITKFNAKQGIVDEKIKGLDGVTRHLRFPDGWSGDIDLHRQNDFLDAYFARWEQNYYDGVDELPCTIMETIAETDGSISQYRYEGVLFKFDDSGDFEGAKSVKQKVSWLASRRLKVS